MATAEKLTNPSVLAFERKLDASDALFSAGTWENRSSGAAWQTLSIREKSIRGTISNRTGKKADSEVSASIESPNLQTIDVVTLPNDADTLRVRFTLRILGGVGTPSACNNTDYQARLAEIVESYRSSHGFTELAERYAANIANGRFLWRNRIGAESVEVQVSRMENGKSAQQWTFNAFSYSLKHFDKTDEQVKQLGAAISAGLMGDGFTLLEIIAYVRIGDGQEVFPSQELVMERSSAKGAKSKTLYHVQGVAGMHSQKIGNALRTIDTWYEDENAVGPIAVEPYGSVTSLGKAFRTPSGKLDFYNLLDSWTLKDKAPEADQQHFIMAVFVRGGVFGESGKE